MKKLLAGGFEPIKNSNIFSMANNNIVYLFIFVGNSVFCAVLNNLVPCRLCVQKNFNAYMKCYLTVLF